MSSVLCCLFGAYVVYLFLNYSLLGFVWTFPFVLFKVPGVPENLSYWCLVTSLLFHLSPRVSVLNHCSPSSEIRHVSISSKKCEYLVAAKSRVVWYELQEKQNLPCYNQSIMQYLYLTNTRWKWDGNLAQKTKNVCCCVLFSVCAVQVQPNGDNIGIVVYAHNSCSTFACHIWILKRVASYAARCWIYDIIFILYHIPNQWKTDSHLSIVQEWNFLKAYTSCTV